MPGALRQSISFSKCGITKDSTGFLTEVMKLSSLSTTTQCLVEKNDKKHSLHLAHYWLWKLRFSKEREWETWGGMGAVGWGGVGCSGVQWGGAGCSGVGWGGV